MDLVERYIYAVVKHLPKKSRIEVTNELRANIEDMLPPSASKAEVKEILIQLGKPEEMAKAYHNDHQYLIGPAYYYSFLTTVKLVVMIVAGIAAVGKIIAIILTTDGAFTPATIFINLFEIIGAVVSSGFISAAIVATVYMIIEKIVHYEAQQGKKQDPVWNPDLLPKVPAQQIPKHEPIVSIVFTLIFAFFILFTPRLTDLYSTAEPIPTIFNADRYHIYLPFLLLYIAFYLAFNVIKLVKGAWDNQLAIVNTIQNLFFSVLATIILLDQSLVDTSFLQYLADLLNISLQTMENGFRTSQIITILVILIITMIDSIMGFVRARRSDREKRFTAEITNKN